MPSDPLPPLLYRCPVCVQEIAVPARVVGETVRCPVEGCGQPVLIDPPRAEFIGAAPEQSEGDGAPPALAMSSPQHQEQALLVLRPSMWRNSPIKFASTWLGVAASAGVLLWSVGGGRPVPGILSAAALVLLLSGLAVWWLSVMATSLTVTTRRSTLRRGIFEKNTNEVQHDDVRNIQVDQSVANRLLGVGTLKISSAGQDGLEIVVEGIDHPAKVAETIRANQ